MKQSWPWGTVSTSDRLFSLPGYPAAQSEVGTVLRVSSILTTPLPQQSKQILVTWARDQARRQPHAQGAELACPGRSLSLLLHKHMPHPRDPKKPCSVQAIPSAVSTASSLVAHEPHLQKADPLSTRLSTLSAFLSFHRKLLLKASPSLSQIYAHWFTSGAIRPMALWKT